MNRFRLLLFTCFLCLVTLNESLAQERGDIRANASLLGSPDVSALGISVGAEYFLTSRLSAAPNLIYNQESRILPITESLLGADLRYYFIKKRVNVYALTGYGLYRVKRELQSGDDIERLNSISAGLGIAYGLSDKLSVTFDSKHWHNSDGLFRVFGLGVAYRLNKRD